MRGIFFILFFEVWARRGILFGMFHRVFLLNSKDPEPFPNKLWYGDAPFDPLKLAEPQSTKMYWQNMQFTFGEISVSSGLPAFTRGQQQNLSFKRT